MKIVVITCYFEPDYVRARVLRSALKSLPGIKLIIIKNKHRGLLRYPEVLWKVWRVRTQKPDAYVLTFRGQEVLPFIQWMIRKKPLIFDELIVPIAYATNEHHAKSLTKRVYYFMARRSESMYRRWLSKCYAILADTAAHAELSARTSHVNLSKYTVLPVGTDDTAFRPATIKPASTGSFQVFYYSTGMQPLHGVQHVLAAAEQLKNNADIEFLLVGGKKLLRDATAAAGANGAHVRYEPWIPFEQLVNTMHSSGICLGGPFGDTAQAHHVITTKTYQILAAGAPVVVGASEATNEYFIDKENALVVPQANPEALVRAITWAQKHPAELAVIAQNGRKLYEKQFSEAAIARILEPLVSSL